MIVFKGVVVLLCGLGLFLGYRYVKDRFFTKGK